MNANPDQTSITAYAAEHDLDPGDLIAIMNTDPEPEEPVSMTGNRIQASDGVYMDAIYTRGYLDMIASNIIPSDPDDEWRAE